MINSSPCALTGLVLVHLAADLYPRDASIQRLRQRLAGWAVFVVVGFALLIPLLSFSALQQYGSQAQAIEIRSRRASERLAALRAAVQSSQTLPQLSARLQTLNGPVLDRSDQALPLGTLKQRLEILFREAEARIRSQSQQRSPQSRWWLIAEIGRTSLACAALAIAFAGLARRKNGWNSLLRELQRWWELNVRRRSLSQARRSKGKGF